MKLKLVKFLTFLCLIMASLTLLAETEKSQVPTQTDSILASVNGVPIILSDVIFESAKDENILAAALDVNQAKEIIAEMRKKLVDDIINRKLIVAEYERGTFRIPEEYVNNAIDDIAQSTNYLSRKKFYQLLRENGLDIFEFREKIREKVIVEYLIGKTLYTHVNISPKKIYEYYQANKETEFTLPDKFELSMIFISNMRENYQETAEKIAETLKNDPSSFPFAAAEYSDNEIGRKNNGIIGNFSLQEIREEFKNFVEQKKLGIVSEPITTSEGIYFLLINKMEEGREIPLREIEQDLRKKLEKTERERVFSEYIEKLRKNAIIEYYF